MPIQEQEFRDAFIEHRHAVYRYAWRLTSSPTAAEDITQEAFFALLRVRAKIDSPSGVRNFLFVTARNLVLKYWRNNQRWTALDEDDEQLCRGPSSFDSSDVSRAVAAAIKALPPLQREVLVMSVYSGFSAVEIAGITAVEVTAVKARLHRARNNMKRMLQALKPAGNETEVGSGTSH
ncbi:MAG: RNA polymerase sigma factor [Acidobacteriaceae bacterium]|nr:RNA polymerase sigma factor [Acidobacteriaceae bacterium]